MCSTERKRLEWARKENGLKTETNAENNNGETKKDNESKKTETIKTKRKQTMKKDNENKGGRRSNHTAK